MGVAQGLFGPTLRVKKVAFHPKLPCLDQI